MNIEINDDKNIYKNKPFARTYPCEKISFSHPFVWLWNGVKDFCSMPIISLFYGICFMVLAFGIKELINVMDTHLVIIPSLIVFVLIGPFLALGLYQASWEKSRGRNPNLWSSITAIRRNSVSQWAFSIVLCVFMIFWLRVASLIHAIYPIVHNAPLIDYLPFLITGSVVGFLFLSVVFAISAFSIPLMLERQVDVMTAIMTSANAVKTNLFPMFMWGILILMLVGISFLTLSIGFIFIMPIIGYATWHSYKSTILSKKQVS